MGIIRAALNAVKGGLADTWLEVIEPSPLGEHTVFAPGQLITQNGKNQNKKGSSNIVSNGSIIHVYPEQMMILMDGGKTQVHAAEEVLMAFGMDIPVCGMVKDDRHRTRGLLFREQEISIPLTSEGFKLVTRIQDEVHRFAITYHRKLRDERNLHSVLDDIKGIGEVRRKALMRHFGSIEKIAEAEVADLLEVDGMTIPAAESVYLFFHQEELQNQ